MAKEPRGSKVISKKHQARMERERMQRRYILFASIAVLVLVIGFVGYGIFEQAYIVPNQPVATVNGHNIKTSDWQARVRFARMSLINQYMQTSQLMQMFGSDPSSQQYFQSSLSQISSQLSDPNSMGQQVMNTMIEDIFIQEEAKKLGITVSDAEVQQSIEQNFGYYPNGTPTPTPATPTIPPSTLSPEQLALITSTPTLTPTVTGTPPTSTPPPTSTVNPSATAGPTNTPTATASPTPAGTATPTPVPSPTPSPTPYTQQMFQQNYATAVASLQKNDQITEAQLRAVIRADLLRQKVMEALTKDLPHTQDQVWLRDITVTSEVTATQVEDQLKKGGDFGALAKQYSTDSNTKDKGGDMGWSPKSSLDTAVADVAFNMKIGEISQPIKTSTGYEIIQLVGHENRQLTDTEYSTLQQQNFTDWLTKQHDAATIKIYDYWQNRVPTLPALPSQAAGG